MSKVTSRSQYINKSCFERPLKQFGLKMSAKSVQRWCKTFTLRNAVADAAKARPPIVAWRTLGITRSMVDDDHNRWWLLSCDTGKSSEARYAGAKPWRQQYTITVSWGVIVLGIYNQCTLQSSGVTWSCVVDYMHHTHKVFENVYC